MMCLLHCWEMSNLPLGITQPVIFFVPNLTPADITDADRLLRIDPELAAKARHILDINKSERHIRGGLATREKYLHLPHVHAG